MRDRNIKKNIMYSAIFMFSCFFILVVYITYLQVLKSNALANNPLNMRAFQMEKNIQRGTMLDRTGKKIAFSERIKTGFYHRVYPYADMMAPVSGYLGENIGNAGIEGYANAALSGQNNPWSRFGPIAQLFSSNRGNDVKLTINVDVQKIAYDALGNRKGAIVVINSKTGAIIAMVSRPSFDPNTVEEDWGALIQNQEGLLLNRVSQGLYPPGSTLKPMIADAALKEKVTDQQEIFDCKGFLKINDSYTLHESHNEVHGSVNLREALTVSCNTTFATLAMRLGESNLEKTFKRFGFTKEIDNEIAEASIQLPQFSKLSEGEICQVGIGQSTVLVTPLRMAMLASAFANQGKIMKPYLIDEIISPSGVIIDRSKNEVWLEATTAERANIIRGFMDNVVTNGTGHAAFVKGIDVAGKTGTAENSSGADHAWFIGSAKLPKEDISFAIIIENSGGGGTEAAPIAKELIMNMLKTEEVAS
jgi:penicillin-binding protein A